MTRTVDTPFRKAARAASALTLIAPLLMAPLAASAQNGDQDYEGYTPPAASAPATATRTGDQISLDPGTVIPVLLNTELTSNHSATGDTFTANVDTSRAAYNSLMRGATVEGVVRHATAHSGNDPGTLELAFTRLRLPNGDSYPISGTVTSLDSKDLQVGGDGVLRAVKINKDQSATYAGIGAGAGALIGILSGGKIRFEDLLLGGGLGYAAGQLLKNTQQVHDVDLKPGTPVGVLLNQRVQYHRSTLNTGTRAGAVTNYRPMPVPAAPTNARRYYSYQGHPYYLDLKTGQRVKLD